MAKPSFKTSVLQLIKDQIKSAERDLHAEIIFPSFEGSTQESQTTLDRWKAIKDFIEQVMPILFPRI